MTVKCSRPLAELVLKDFKLKNFLNYNFMGPGMVMHICSPTTWEAEIGRIAV
jgi:hypothetical protein